MGFLFPSLNLRDIIIDRETLEYKYLTIRSLLKISSVFTLIVELIRVDKLQDNEITAKKNRLKPKEYFHLTFTGDGIWKYISLPQTYP